MKTQTPSEAEMKSVSEGRSNCWPESVLDAIDPVDVFSVLLEALLGILL